MNGCCSLVSVSFGGGGSIAPRIRPPISLATGPRRSVASSVTIPPRTWTTAEDPDRSRSGGRSLRAVLEPAADLRVDPRVVEQVEVVEPAEAQHVVGRERQPVVAPRVAGGAARRDQ